MTEGEPHRPHGLHFELRQSRPSPIIETAVAWDDRSLSPASSSTALARAPEKAFGASTLKAADRPYAPSGPERAVTALRAVVHREPAKCCFATRGSHSLPAKGVP
jgi:hypothetical protein